MNTFKILNNQIKAQVTGATRIKIYFKNSTPDFAGLYCQNSDIENQYDYFFKTGFLCGRKISKEAYDDLMSQIESEEYDEDWGSVNIIRSKLKYDDFYDKYFNCFECENPAT